jgi:hypothetical protein
VRFHLLSIFIQLYSKVSHKKFVAAVVAAPIDDAQEANGAAGAVNPLGKPLGHLLIIIGDVAYKVVRRDSSVGST